MPEHQLPTDPDTASATAKDAPSDVAAAPLEGISVSEPEDALPRVTLADLPQAIADNARAGDVVLCMGAGSIGAVPGKVVEMLQNNELSAHDGKAL